MVTSQIQRAGAQVRRHRRPGGATLGCPWEAEDPTWMAKGLVCSPGTSFNNAKGQARLDQPSSGCLGLRFYHSGA